MYAIRWQIVKTHPVGVGCEYAHTWNQLNNVVGHRLNGNVVEIITGDNRYRLIVLNDSVLTVECERPPVDMKEWEDIVSDARERLFK